MATNAIEAVWTSSLSFDGHQQDMVMPLSSTITEGASGFSPKQLLLTALAGCTGMDVASLLPKMRVPFTSLVVKVSGVLAEEHPKTYVSMHVTYEVGVGEEFREQVKRAVELSETRYCGVSAMPAKAAENTYEIVLVG